jgi:hypothetical protein
MPEARVGIRCERFDEAHIIAPQDWGNIWVYGMDIFLAGYIPRDEFRRRANLIPPGSRVFQYNQTRVKNLAVPMRDLKSLGSLFERVKEWEEYKRGRDE